MPKRSSVIPRPTVKAPNPSLPKGGGAVRGLGEKFNANLAMGTGTFNVPIATTPCRGLTPELALTYDSGTGNGPFGAGWHLSVPSITRKTDKGLPEYTDHWDTDSFILSGAEDLVPVLGPDGKKLITTQGGRRIQRYQPRVEGAFARVERITEAGAHYWQVTTKDNIRHIYGKSKTARVADALYPDRIFTWLLERTEDARGNIIQYEYKAEDLANVPKSLHEKHRHEDPQLFSNSYLKRVRYGNKKPGEVDDFYFQVVFDYGEHEAETPTPNEVKPWPCRKDPFSSYRATFEIRTYRLCRRVLVFHHFPELGAEPVLVRSTDFAYAEAPTLSQLVAVTQSGYIQKNGGYSKKSLPPLELGYSLPELNTEVQTVAPEYTADVGNVDGKRARWVDLEGEGLPGVLVQHGEGLFYKQNLGEAELAPARQLMRRPNALAPTMGRTELLDLEHEGRPSLVFFNRTGSGTHERTEDGEWGPFMAFSSHPNIPWNDPGVRFIDITGDGQQDIIFTSGHVHIWFPSLGKNGWGPPRNLPMVFDEDLAPTEVYRDNRGIVFVADMTGDGMPDIVRIKNGSICYWPNRGLGRLGPKVEMSNAPRFDDPLRFDPRRIRLADINGSGTTDILYIGADGIQIAFNQAGNSWSKVEKLPGFPTADLGSPISVLDFLGTGTACIVWSSPWKGVAQPPMRYIDLLGSKKPYLLTSVKNNLGAEMKLEYAPSTKFYLEDLKNGTPWVTRLPFPVHVLARVETHDAVSGTRFVSTYNYHHGYYDSAEKEFRGFGLVEQWDAESFSEDEHHLPPVLTKTWFHTGAFFDKERIEEQFAREYYALDAQAPVLPQAVLPPGMSPREAQEAARALKGQVLRQEIYGLDGSPQQEHPYLVTSANHEIRKLQPATDKAHAVFFPYVREKLEAHYERNPKDTRVVHTLALEVDSFGHVTRSATVAYARRNMELPEQGLLATITEAAVANEPAQSGFYRLGVPVETRTYELTGLPKAQSACLPFATVLASVNNAATIPYEATPDGSLQKRLVEHVGHLYWDSSTLAGPLPLGAVDGLALPYETYALAFTPGLLAGAYGSRVTPQLLVEGGYVEQDGLFWIRSGRETFDPTRFYLPIEVRDPLGQTTEIGYDSHNLLVVSVVDPLGNEITAENDYRTMCPVLVTDPNKNRTAVELDELGLVVATAVMGKVGAAEGDMLAEPTSTFEYDLERWWKDKKPNVVHAAARERHGDPATPWQHSYTYLDGLGREVMKKVRAEAGPAPKRDQNGILVKDAQGQLVLENTTVRWVGTGRTVFDNKGNAVKKYEPFFSATHEYEDEKELVEWGVTPVSRYDPLGRLVRTDHPNGTFSRVEFTPWKQTSWDENDTVLESAWYAARQAGASPLPSAQEQRAALLAAKHAGTPAALLLDVLGRPVVKVEDNGASGKYTTTTTLDIKGNPLAVIDARGNTAVTQLFDMLSRPLSQKSIDAGERWTFFDVLGNPIRSWDSRGHVVRSVYDALHRRTELWVQKDAGAEILAEKTSYGEGQPNAQAANLRGRVYQARDGAGLVTHVAYDFKGNLLEVHRQLAKNYKGDLDWSASPVLEAETFVQKTQYDALNRPTSLTTPDQSEARPKYNEAGLLEQVDVRLRGSATWTTFVDDIDYDAKGQREKIVYGNGVVTAYSYDPLTFRLTRIKTTRSSGGALLQDLRYTYDPVGNIVEIADLAQKTVFNNGPVEPVWKYEYDALYRLSEATGREHAGQNSDIQQDESGFPLLNVPHPNDPQALRNYTERYQYDAVGNIEKMIHEVVGLSGSWTRRYDVAPDNNRLLRTSLPGDADGDFSAKYGHDAHGNMTSMPHLPSIGWDFKDEKREVDKGGGGKVYFTYDAAGQRVRKVWEHNGIAEERIYLGGFEIYRRSEAGSLVLERETLHVMDGAQRIALAETKTVDASVPNLVVSSRVRYQLGNHLGSAALELDETGLVISYEEYHPFGTTAFHAAASGVEVSAKRYRYTGKERDEETGLYYHGARYYAPWLGRWTSADPAGVVDGPNLYAYGRNSPLRFVDPDGRQALVKQTMVRPPRTPADVQAEHRAQQVQRPPPPTPPQKNETPAPAPTPAPAAADKNRVPEELLKAADEGKVRAKAPFLTKESESFVVRYFLYAVDELQKRGIPRRNALLLLAQAGLETSYARKSIEEPGKEPRRNPNAEEGVNNFLSLQPTPPQRMELVERGITIKWEDRGNAGAPSTTPVPQFKSIRESIAAQLDIAYRIGREVPERHPEPQVRLGKDIVREGATAESYAQAAVGYSQQPYMPADPKAHNFVKEYNRVLPAVIRMLESLPDGTSAETKAWATQLVGELRAPRR
ncbi:SpvB/TcaC N-terminal domain-containing protein [Polyangium aurulentum]|uniref:SpvB/TcaC N-terminal domain-containing protein n=1 Tax=Polyangium aurulentum TaxID=2567896 RepID=UPI00146A2539|nr:SpvB/TcaC N-terminal domain-containing protein [Polyangium aurulentum]UQA61432.1 toxin [Polyangium aurulentum]